PETPQERHLHLSTPLFGKLRAHVNAPFCSIPIDLEGPRRDLSPCVGFFAETVAKQRHCASVLFVE
ncbi:hypothetical protein, partial [Mesorhizobium sp. M4A.F.Ca.ET.090.04.2.1]|uniref:hypothetical protein n=1 Tax=Mesorhizobium sp. M4A.F.Ca.ET.090.04.2.1 TaxID=2496663 RepID=UPI001AECE089